MLDLKIVLMTGGVLFFIFLVACVIALVNKLNTLSGRVKDSELDLFSMRQEMSNLKFTTMMGDNIKINDVLWSLLSKCGYKINTMLPTFELVKIKKRGGVK